MRVVYEWRGHRCVVEAPDEPALIRDLPRLFEGGHGTPVDAAAPDLLVSGTTDGMVVSSRPTESCEGHSELVSLLEFEVTQWFLGRRSDEVHLHAGGAVAGDGAILVVGPSGSGKSTTAHLLAREGLPSLGDDVVLLDDQARASAFPRPFKLDVDRARSLGLAVEETLAYDPSYDEVWWSPAPGEWAQGYTPVRVVADVRYTPGSPLTEEVLPPDQALRVLIDNTHRSGLPVQHGMDRLVRLSEQAVARSFRFGDAGTLCARLLELARTTGG